MDTTNHTINNGYPYLTWQNGVPSALPVEMTGLTAVADNADVELFWSTMTEVDNAGWDIERMSDAPQSGATSPAGQLWTKIGFVRGAGTSNRPLRYSYFDEGVLPGIYSYRLKQLDRNGAAKYSPVTQAEVSAAPTVFALEQNYPNPFNPTTTIGYSVPAAAHVAIAVYSALGQKVAQLVNETKTPGSYSVGFSGTRLGSGIYFVRMTAGSYTETKKMLLLK